MTSFINTIDYKYLYSTVKIEGVTSRQTYVTGTGFYFCFEKTEQGDLVGIVTNRHVLEDVVEATIKVILVDDKEVTHDTSPLSIVITDLSDKIFYHSDIEVDLCVIPLASLLEFEKQVPKGWTLCIHAFSEEDLLTQEDLEEITAIEEVVMIGYPDGLIDEINYKPIIRKGITATHIKVDYEGEKDFLIDMYCFSGSSGSPVLLYKHGPFRADDGYYIGVRTKLIGVLYAGHDTTIEGELVKTKIKNIHTPIISININIGCVLKAERIIELGEVIKKNV